MKRHSWLLVLSTLTAAVLSGQQPAAPSTFKIVRPTLHQRNEDGPTITNSYEYLSGELMYFTFRVSGYKVQKDKVDLRWQIIAVDPEGLLLFAPINGAIREEVSYNDSDWLPKISQTMPLPAQIPPGAYKLKLSVADELAAARAETELNFKVGGKPFPKVEGLSILNLGFYQTEADRQPMATAVYRTGQQLLARFVLAGFQLGEKNKFAVEYGLAILSPSGKVLYTQEKAAADDGSPFYPQRLLNGALSLNLTEGVQAAEYTLQVKAKDLQANTMAEASAVFRVEK